MNRAILTILFFALSLLALVPGAVTAGPTALNLVVNNSLVDAVDANPGDGLCETAAGNGVCTLRAAVMEANATPGHDTITLPAGVFYLTRPATGFEDAALDGDLDLTDDVTITGAGQAETIIDANRSVTNARVFQILSGVTVEMAGLTIRNGANEPGPGITGGILNLGELALDHVSLLENERGALDNRGTAVLDYVTVSNNNLSVTLYNSNATLTVKNSTISGNTVHGNASGIGSVGSLLVVNTTISNNETIGLGNSGGGLWLGPGTATIVNSTISGNQVAGRGGGLYIWRSADSPTTVNLHNVTIVDNVADTTGAGGVYQGGGIYVSDYMGFIPEVNMTNTILANNRARIINPAASDCWGEINSGGYNLIETTTDCTLNGVTTGNLTGVDPLLDVLADNGGPTWTHEPGGYSPAIDAGNPAGCADPLGVLLESDQRGYPRPVDGGSGTVRCDMGAFEYGASLPGLQYITYIPMVLK
jgi:CSLREA domain-containing protein